MNRLEAVQPLYVSRKGDKLLIKTYPWGRGPFDLSEDKRDVHVYSYDFETKKCQEIPEDGGRYYPSINGYVVRKDLKRLVLEVPGKPDEVLLQALPNEDLLLRAWDYDPVQKALVWMPENSINIVYYRDAEKSWTSSVMGYEARSVAFSPRGRVWVDVGPVLLFDMRRGGIMEFDEYGGFIGWRSTISSGVSVTGVAMELSPRSVERVRRAFAVLNTNVPYPKEG
jgi:hypothetical protein